MSGGPEAAASAPAELSSRARLSELKRLNSRRRQEMTRVQAALMIMNLISATHARPTAPQGIEEGEEVAEARFCSQYCWAVGSRPI